MTLEEYRERVEAVARQRAGEPVFNGSVEHAAIIVESMFQHAHKCVGLLTGKLNPRVYGPEKVIEEARLFLAEPQHDLRILIEEPDPEALKSNPFFDLVQSSDNCEIRRLNVKEGDQPPFHFLVMDSDSYRFESDKNSCQAIAAFGDPKGGQNLKNLFDVMWENASDELPVTG